MYMFLDNRNTNGNDAISEAIIEMKATFRLELNIKKDIIKAAIPTATFKP